MRYIYIVLISLFIAGCSTNDIDYALARAAGNKPATFFVFDSVEEVNKWQFETKDYKALPPQTYQKDWELMSPWHGAYIYGGIAFGNGNKDENQVGLYIGYGINMMSSTGKYEDEDNEREKGNIEYFKKKYSQRKLRDGTEISINRHIERHGIEKYFCEVSNRKNEQRGVIEKIYECHKPNLQKTKDKSVTIVFIYTKSPNLPKKYQH
jgi:hypothetical protein